MQLKIKRFDELTPHELYGILALRSAVFVVEQQCIYQDVDGRDLHAIHVWLEDEKGVAGCLRVLPAGVQDECAAIGRVISRDRGQGIGMRLLLAGMDAARKELHADRLVLEAQCYAQAFYEKAGFRAVSEPFLEDGIPHIRMACKLVNFVE